MEKMDEIKGSSRGTLGWIGATAGMAKSYILLLLTVQAVLGISSVGYALLLRRLINAAVAGERTAFFEAIGMFALLVMAQVLLRALNRHFEELSRAILENRFKDNLFSNLLKSDYASVTKVHSGEWMNRLTSDTVVVADGMTQILPGLTGMAVKMIGALAAILWMEPRFLYILIPGGILLVFFSYAFRKVMKRLHKVIQEKDGFLRVFLSEHLGSLIVIRTFAQEKNVRNGAWERMKAHQDARMKRNVFSNICNIGFGTVMNGAYVLGAFFGGYGILTGTMTYGNLIAILQLISQIQNPFANITGYLPRYYGMLASAERLMEAEEFEKEEEDIPSEEEVQSFYKTEFQGLGLRHAAFTYQPPVQQDGKQTEMPIVFADLNLKIQKGEYVAFVGPSGCGKSTVLKLLMCLYSLDHGKRYLKTESGELDLSGKWRTLFAYVPQGNQLLSGTIREIVAFGDPEKMKLDERLHQALEIACAEEFVQELERGVDTLLGERGMGLSEGQMQRIAVARAIFSEHPILLLDEATSSLDEATEAKLLANLRNMTEKTVIIVTHRAAVLGICDKTIEFR